MTPAQIYRLWLADVTRWHHSTDHRLRNSGDTIQSHQGRVAQLLDMLFPDWTRDEMRQAIWHDAPESWTGDPSYMAKHDPAIKDAHDKAEGILAKEYGLPVDCSPRVKLCDGIDCILWAASRGADFRYDGWMDHIAAVRAQARANGVGNVLDVIFLRAKVK